MISDSRGPADARAAIDVELGRFAGVPTLAELRRGLRLDPAWCSDVVLFATHRTRDGLIAKVDALLGRLARDAGGSVRDVARTTRPERCEVERAVVVAATRDEAIARLQLVRRKLARCERLAMPGAYFAGERPRGRTAFLFPGQGCQFPRMLVHLAMRSPEVLEWFSILDGAYAARGDPPPSRFLLEPANVEPPGLLDLRTGAQLGLIASLAMHDVLVAWGVEADAMVGHSNGEHAALVAGGAFRFASKPRLAAFFCTAGLLLDGVPRPRLSEDVIAVGGASEASVEAVLAGAAGEVFLAIDNCPRQKVLAGTAPHIAEAAARLEEAGASVMRVPIGRAYHTPLFDPCAAVMRRHYEALSPGECRVPVISCLDGRPHGSDLAEVADRVAEQWRSTVSFRETIEALHARGVRHFVEVGPDETLASFVRDTLRGRPHSVASASSRRRDDIVQLKHLLAQLVVFGPGLPPHAFDWLDRVDAGARTRASLPLGSPPRGTASPGAVASSSRAGAIEQARRLYAEVATRARVAEHRASHRVVAPRQAILTTLEAQAPAVGIARLSVRTHPWLLGHAFGRGPPPGAGGGVALASTDGADGDRGGGPLPVLSFTTSMALVCELATRRSGRPVRELRELKARRWLALDGGTLPLRYRLSSDGGGWVRVQLWDARAVEDEPAFEGLATDRDDVDGTDRSTPGSVDPTVRSLGAQLRRFYRDIAFHGPRFRGIEQIERLGDGRLRATVRVTGRSVSPGLDPALWDCVGQVAAVHSLDDDDRPFGLYPLWADRCRLIRRPLHVDARALLEARVEPLGDTGTRTSAVWLDVRGRELGRLEGLQQRRIPLHPVIQRLLRQPLTRRARVVDRDPVPPDFEAWLRHNDPIWIRMLASCCLSPSAWADWAERPPAVRLPDLLHSIRSMRRPWQLS